MKTKTKQTKIEFDITKFKFLRDLLLIKAIRPEGTNGLVDPHSYEDKPEFGTVIAVGDEVKDIKVGDVVRFGKYSTENIRTKGQDYFIVHSEDLSAVLK